MDWILVFLDTIFGGLVTQSGWFEKIAQKFTGSVEELVYKVEDGALDVNGLSHTIEHVAHWLPVVFIVCLTLDLVIRSRFVRYSYRDENQAKKSVWWRWQSDEDAAAALEAGMQQAALAQHAGADGAFDAEEAEHVQDETLDAAEPAEDAGAQDEEPLDDAADGAQEQMDEDARRAEDDAPDRGPVVSAKQNRVHRGFTLVQRLQGAALDVKDGLTIARSAVVFAPKAIARNARMMREGLAESSRRGVNKMRCEERAQRPANARSEAAETEAFFAQDAQIDYLDGEYAQVQPVDTGGIEGYSFAEAARTIQSARREGEEAPQNTAKSTVEKMGSKKRQKKLRMKKRERLTFQGRKKKTEEKPLNNANQATQEENAEN